MKRSKAVAILLGAIATISAAIFATVPAIAKDYAVADSTNTILRKAMLEDTYYAYDSHHLQDEIVVSQYNNIGAIAKSSSKYNLPLVYTNKKNTKSSDFFAGKDGLAGAFMFFGIDDASANNGAGVGTQAKTSFLTKAGYAKEVPPDEGAMQGVLCVKFYYNVWKYGAFWGYKGNYSAYSDYICVKTTAKPTGDNNTFTTDDYLGAVIQDHPYIVSSGDQPDGIPSGKPIVMTIVKSTKKIMYVCADMSSYFGGGVAWYDILTLGGTSVIQSTLSSLGFSQPVGVWSFIDADDCTEATSYVIGTTTYRDLILGIVANLMEMSNETVTYMKDFAGYQYVYAFGSNNYNMSLDENNPFAAIADVAAGDEVNATYKLATDAKQTALNSMMGGTFSYDNTSSGSKFTKQEKFILYDAYIKEVFEIDEKLAEDTTLGTDGFQKTRLINAESGDVETFYVKPKNNTTGLAKVKDNYHFSPTETVTFAEVASYLLNETSITHIDPAVLAQYAPKDASQGGGELDPADVEAKKDCYSGAGSLGWVVCPIIYDLAGFIKDKYTQWVEPALQINTNLFGADGSTDTYDAWNVFRNIANVFFVIIFLVIIFSQLTGVGIDNYGIKKILPKLIIGAILINLSYVICQLAIDVANIVGYGIAGIFKGISNSVGSPSSITLENTTVSASNQEVGWFEGGGKLGLVVTLIIGVISVAAVLSQGTAIIIPVLLAVIGVAISLFTLIAILGMRQAAAVLLVVGSPLAFVAYMLPNTKKLFDKWLKVFEGLLIAFPACSALIYGGDMVGRILLNCANGSTWVVLSAGIVSIAPIFFIPKLIKTSMGAVSNAASKITGGLNRGINKGIGGSQWAKNLRADNERRRMLNRSGYKFDKNGNPTRTARGWLQDNMPFKTQAAKNRIARYRSAAMRDVAEAGQASRMLGAAGTRTMQNYAKANAAKLENQDVQDEMAAMVLKEPELRQQSKLEDAFRKYLQGGIETEQDELRFKAIASKLAASGAGQKAMAKEIRKGGDAGAMKTLANFAMSNGGEIANKIAAKDTYAAQYLEDNSSLGEKDKIGSFADWQNEVRNPNDPKDKQRTNRDWVTGTRLDKNDLFSQGKDAVIDALSTTGEGAVSADRIDAALKNPNLNMNDEVKNLFIGHIEKQAEAAGIHGSSATGTQSGSTQTTQTQTTQTAPAPAQTQTQTTQTAPAPAQTQTQSDQPQRFAPRTQMAIENEQAQAILNNPGSGVRLRREAQEILDRNNNRKP